MSANCGNHWLDRPVLGLAAATALASLLQGAIAAQSPLVSPDAYTFAHLARQLGTDPVATLRSADQHPGFPALILLVQGLSQSVGADSGTAAWIQTGRWIDAVAGLVGVGVVWALAWRVFSTRVANVAALLLAGLPVFRQNAVDALSDAPHLVFYVGATWLACEGLARRSCPGTWRWFAACGACSGLAFWIRPEGLSVAIVMGALWVGSLSWWRDLTPRQWFLSLAAVAGSAALVIAPYLVLSGKVTSKIRTKLTVMRLLDQGIIRPDGHIPQPHVTPEHVTAQRDVAGAPAPPPRLEHIPPRISSVATALTAVADGTRETGRRFSQCLRVVLLFPLAIGIWIASKTVDSRTRRLFWSLGVFHLFLVEGLYLIGGYVDRRHVLPLVAILTPLVALGMCEIHARAMRFQWLAKRGAPAASGLGLVLAVAVGACLLPRAVRPLNEAEMPAAAALEWIRHNTAPADRLLSNSRPLVLGTNAAGGAVCDAWHVVDSPSGDRPPTLDRARFVAIELENSSQPAWDQLLRPDFEPVASFRGSRALRQQDVVLYQRIETVARHQPEISPRR